MTLDIGKILQIQINIESRWIENLTDDYNFL